MRIVVDAMGGDYAPVEVVKGAVDAALADNLEIVLVGKQPLIEAELAKYRGCDSCLSLVHASEVVECSEQPTEAIRSKPDSSIVVGMNLLKSGQASAFVSAGASGAVVCAAMLSLGKLDGVARPALACLFPSTKGLVLLIDAGANADCRPPFLVQFAQMGSIFMEKIQGVERPRVGLLSSGEEVSKGNRLVKEAHQLLRATNLNFVGNIEGKDIPRGLADVVVTDGFTGNVALKTSEGMGEAIYAALKEALNNNTIPGITSFLMRPALRALSRWVDYSEYGGALLVGVPGNVIVAHGRSHSGAIRNAILLAKKSVESQFVEMLRQQTLEPVTENNNSSNSNSGGNHG
jgi:glycerol-3-phosphate acyltransferase PlsX